jgi:hypothetical protein
MGRWLVIILSTKMNQKYPPVTLHKLNSNIKARGKGWQPQRRESGK